MSLTIKICGLSDEASLDAALDAGADMVGFVFFAPSPRNLSFARGRDLGGRVGGRALKVALTVDADDATLAAVIEAIDPDMIQLHGRETPERVSSIRARFGRPVMRALALRGDADVGAIAAFDKVADHLLFDAPPPAGADRPGGHGTPFDWHILNTVSTHRPWLLAGGIGPANVADAVASTRAHGVDVSSGVESAPGRKDPARIAEFVARARAASRPLGSVRAIG